ncbi:MAG: T9SS type A sorting domain-containing protein [Bacteroidia bacterium]|nr:T9SS type A sorting domain-containing protein [Bacteroidia bacterium]
MKLKLSLIIFLLFLSAKTFAQNCTVNANIDQTICVNQSLSLTGSKSGLFQPPNTSTWSQISGPSVVIVSPNSLTTSVTGYSANKTYIFRLSTTCSDGTKIFDDVKVFTQPITISNAGPDQTACPGSSLLAGNSPGVNESGSWSIVSANNAGVTINSPSSATSTISTTTSAAGSSTLRWTITNTNTCSSFDDVVITNYGGVQPVDAGPYAALGRCYSVSQCYNLNATFGGNNFGSQQGTWTLVTGPTNVTFSNNHSNTSNVCGLVGPGTYKLKWTVSGPCANGSDTMSIYIPAPTQSTSATSAPNQVFCDARTVAFLVGNSATYSGEKVRWTQLSDPSSVVFSNDSASSTSISNLNGSGTYTFRYTITNSVTGCNSSTTASISYTNAPSISSIRDSILPCNVISTNVSVTSSGGNQLYYTVISAPVAWGSTPSGNNPIASNPFTINGLTAPETYIIRVTRATNNGVGCSNVSTDFRIVTSKTPLGANAGTPQFLPCNVDTTLLAGNVPLIGYGTWSVLNGPSGTSVVRPNDPNTLVTGFSRGLYTFRWTINGGPKCPKAESDVQVVFAPTLPQSISAGSSRTVCYGTPITLDGNVPAKGETGTWSVTPSAGITITTVNKPNAVVTGMVANTAYTFKWVVSNICGKDSSTVVITTNSSLGPPKANAGSDRCISSGTTSITLAGNNPAPAKGAWTKVSGPAMSFTNDSLFNTTATGLTNGTYIFEWINIRGTCAPTRDSVMITISSSATVANAGIDRDSCGNSVTLSATPVTIGIGTWTLASGPAGWSITDIHSPTARLTGLISGGYRFAWTVTNNACSGSTDTVEINIDNKPIIPVIGGSQKLCGGTSLTLTANRIKNGVSIWSLNGAAPNVPNIADPDSATTLVSNLITGIYNFKYTAYSNGGLCPAQSAFVSDTVVISAAAGADAGYCNLTSTSLIGPSGSIGTWTKAAGGSGTVTTTSNNSAIVTGISPAGSPYKFAFTVPARWGCPQTTDTMQVIISDTTKVPNAGTDQALCNASSFTLAGNNVSPNTAVWTKSAGPAGTITTPTLFNSTVTGVTTGLYLFTWTVTNGFCSRADEVRIENFAAPTTANAGADTTICPGYVKMRANIALIGVGNWRQVSGPLSAVIEEPANPATKITGMTSTGTYKYVWDIRSGGVVCSPSIDTIAIFVPSLNPTVSNAGSDSAICVRTTTALNGNSAIIGTGAWSKQNVVPSSTIATPASNTSGLTLTTSGTYNYIWTITNGLCVSRDTVKYVLSSLPTVATASPSNIKTCIGQPVNLNGNNPSSGAGTWRQIKGPFSTSFTDSTSPTPVVLGIDTGTYIYRWRIKSGSCPTSDAFDTVKIVKIPAIAIGGARQVICQNFTTLNGSVDSVGTGMWTQLSGPNTATIAAPATRNTGISGLTNGNYTFRWAITNGNCVSIDSTKVSYSFPMVNNACSSADSLYKAAKLNSGLDSLCAATAEIGEPATCGKAACNSNMYKFRTNNSIYYQPFNAAFSNISKCSNGLRVSIFNTGVCPGLGSQMGTCQTISSSGTLTWILAPATEYYMIVDDNSPTCGFSSCKYQFQTSGAALPVHMLSFTADLFENRTTKVKWNLASETDNAGFEVERLYSGSKGFEKVGFVRSNGNTSAPVSYNFIDDVNELPAGPITYRLKQIDLNGTITYSTIAVVYKRSAAIEQAKIYPNPNTGLFNLEFNSHDEQAVKVTVTDMVGKNVYTQTVSATDGLNTNSLNLIALPEGIYTVTMQYNGGSTTEKFAIIK